MYLQFDKNQAWDSPQNLPLSQTTVKAFQNPPGAAPPPGQTDFLFVTGRGTVFEPGMAIGNADIIDDASKTVVVIEVKTSGVMWAEPSDLDLSQPTPLPPGNDPGGNYAAFADGSVRLVPKTMSPVLVREMATRDGGEPPVDF